MATRSPNYPQISFSDAVERIGRIYQKEHTHVTKDEVFAKDLGYTSLNGTSAGVISALRKYGLLEGVKDNSKVSSDAVAIIELPPENPDRVEAIRRSAFRPALFSEFRAKYGNILPSDSSLRYYLLQKKFHPRTTDEVIRSYRDTVEFVEQEAPQYHEEEDTQEGTSVQTPPIQAGDRGLTSSGAEVQLPIPAVTQPPIDQSLMKRVTFLTLEANEAVLLLPSNITQESVELIARLLDAQKVVFPTKASLALQAPLPPTSEPPPPVSIEATKMVAPQPPRSLQPSALRTGRAIWRHKDGDLPIVVVGEAGEHEGRRYLRVEDSNTAIPADEVEFISP